MDQNSTLSESRRAAVGYLSRIFSEIACAEGRGLLESEDLCMREGHLLLAEALSSALERYDDLLCSKLPDGLRIHDRRRRMLESASHEDPIRNPQKEGEVEQARADLSEDKNRYQSTGEGGARLGGRA